MKKRLIIIAISVVRFLITGAAQEFPKAWVNKQYRCFVSIETINGNQIEAALSCLTADSIVLAPVETQYVRAGGKYIKILRESPDTAIAIDQLGNFKIKYDPNIIRHDELVPRKKLLRKKKAGKIVGITVWTAATIALIPVATYTGTSIDPVSSIPFSGTSHRSRIVTVPGNNLVVKKSYKTFTINGDNDHYIKMVKRLTRSNANPFENSIAIKQSLNK